MAAARRDRGSFMWPWETEPASAATGILDDETYDWAETVEGMLVSGGGPLVVSEAEIRDANDLGVASTGVGADETGTAGLAGLIRARRDGLVDPGERVAVLFTGRRRPA
jgi:threonine synthase